MRTTPRTEQDAGDRDLRATAAAASAPPPSRSAAIGRHAGRAQRRRERRQRRSRPCRRPSETMIVRVAIDVAVRRQVDADRAEQRPQAPAHRDAEQEAERATRARRSIRPSPTTERSTWPPRGAERPQQRELPRALRDGDRERVEDDERADEQRDAGERRAAASSGSSRLSLDVVRLLARLLLAGPDVAPSAAARCASWSRSCSGVTPGLRRRPGSGRSPRLPSMRCASGRSMPDDRRAAERVDAGDLRDADERVVLARRGRH